MQLPPNFRIMITGKTIDVIRRNNVDNKSAMVWYLTKLLEGEELPDAVGIADAMGRAARG